MKRSAVTILVLVGMLAIGCGSGDSAKTEDAVKEATHSAEHAAESAVDAVDDVAESMEEAVEDDPMALCMKLAAAKNWKDALAPCTEAAKASPDDLGIKHALQQAQAAAKE